MVTVLSSFDPLLSGGRWENSVRVSNLSIKTTHASVEEPPIIVLAILS